MRLLCSIPLLIAFTSMSQQLVLNPSFEDHTTCPTYLNQLDRALNWNSPTTAIFGLSGTPDYFHACNSGIVGVPANNNGYQPAHTGDAYALFVCYLPGTPDFREYIQGTLTTPLLQGQCYHLEFYLNQTNGAYATTDIGVWFTDTQLSGINNYAPLPYTPQIIYTGPVITDTAAWVLVSGDIIAAGGEVAFIIGLFQDDASSSFTYMGGLIPQCGYFVDDVTLVPRDPLTDPCSLPTTTGAGQVEPYAHSWIDPASGELVAHCTEGVQAHIQLFDLSGRLLFSDSFVGHARFGPVDMASGVYICQLSTGHGDVLAQRLVKP